MAEEKKKILIHTADGDHVVSVGEHKPKQTFGAMPVKDYVAAVADPDGLPQAGSVGAVVSALAAAMGSLAVRALRSDDASLQKTAEELRQMTDYMVFQIDEELRAREPLDRRRVEENVTRTDLDSALRVASDIPNEIVYIMCRCIELMKEVVDKGDDLTACSALAAVHLSMAAIRCMQAELLSYAKIMDDDVFGYTIVREAELNLADHQELVDTREKVRHTAEKDAHPGLLFLRLAKLGRVCYDAHGNLSNALDRVGTARQVRRDGKLSGDEGAARPAVLLPLPLPPGEDPRRGNCHERSLAKCIRNGPPAALTAAASRSCAGGRR